MLLIVVTASGCSTAARPAPVEDRTAGAMPKTGVMAGTEASPVVIKDHTPANDRNGLNQGQDGPGPAANPAVVALLSDAEKNIRSGNEDRAAAAVERALRLEPKDPYLWHRLAGIRLKQNNWQQAYVLASKSNSLARGNKPLQIANWEIIAFARSRQGDKTGVEQASKEIERLKKQ